MPSMCPRLWSLLHLKYSSHEILKWQVLYRTVGRQYQQIIKYSTDTVIVPGIRRQIHMRTRVIKLSFMKILVPAVSFKRREFSGGPWVRIHSFMAENMGSVLGEELRSLKLYGTAKKKKGWAGAEMWCQMLCKRQRKKGSSDGRIRENK